MGAADIITRQAEIARGSTGATRWSSAFGFLRNLRRNLFLSHEPRPFGYVLVSLQSGQIGAVQILSDLPQTTLHRPCRTAPTKESCCTQEG
jgi:hypothetical protein